MRYKHNTVETHIVEDHLYITHITTNIEALSALFLLLETNPKYYVGQWIKIKNDLFPTNSYKVYNHIYHVKDCTKVLSPTPISTLFYSFSEQDVDTKYNKNGIYYFVANHEPYGIEGNHYWHIVHEDDIVI